MTWPVTVAPGLCRLASQLVTDEVVETIPPQTAQRLEKRPRVRFRQPLAHCSWMDQVEQWCSILQRKRPAIANINDKTQLAERLHDHAHRFE